MPLKICFGVLAVAVLALSATSTYSQEKKTTPQEKNKPSADTTIVIKCNKVALIGKIIDDAITIGAPLYNSGYHLYCYRIYEWAGYKILYEFGSPCPDVEAIIRTAIEKSHGDYSETEKAWIMRVAFDKVMGVPTQFGEPRKENKERTIKG